MQTITFYSYKGGAGRTLVVANAAEYLVRLGQRVFALDLDLEAPGLHYKVWSAADSLPAIEQGVVDYLNTSCETKPPASLKPYTIEVKTDHPGSYVVMPAGSVPSSEYWRKLARIDWHKMFYSDDPIGIPLFLELQEQIKREFAPDFLLIDSRTGITEIGGVATSILPEKVVCLLMNNRENLEGARAVLRSIRNAPRLPGQSPIEIIPVLSRLPFSLFARHGSPNVEVELLNKTLAFLCEPTEKSEEPLDLPHGLVLHSEDGLQYKERLRVGLMSVDESPLLRDYLRLFSHLIPKEMVEPHLNQLIANAQRDIIENPKRVEDELESLAAYCPHPESYMALLKFYRLRSRGPTVLLDTATRYWELSKDSTNILLQEIIKEHFSADRIRERHTPTNRTQFRTGRVLDFVESCWKAWESVDDALGLQLVDSYFALHNEAKAIETLNFIVDRGECGLDGVVGCVERLANTNHAEDARSLIQRHVAEYSANAEFQASWAKVVVELGDPDFAKRLVKLDSFLPAQLQASHPMRYVRLLRIAGQSQEMEAALRSALDVALAQGPYSKVVSEVVAVYQELGLHAQLEDRLRRNLPSQVVEELMGGRRPRARAVRTMHVE